jgi:CMP/dCMP kinase
LRQQIIALDGPAGSGKSAALIHLERYFNILGVPVIRFSTGNIYRAIAAEVIKMGEHRNLEANDCVNAAQSAGLNVRLGKVFRGVKEVPEVELLDPTVEALVARIAEIREVREYANKVTLWTISNHPKHTFLLDGRNNYALTFPQEAELFLFYVDVSPQVAADRRRRKVDEIVRRNKIDTEREFEPLKKVPEHTYVLTDDMTPVNLVRFILQHVQHK